MRAEKSITMMADVSQFLGTEFKTVSHCKFGQKTSWEEPH